MKGAIDNRRLFHMVGDEKRAARNRMLRATDWKNQTETEFMWNDLTYQADMLGFDFIADADRAFENWVPTSLLKAQPNL